MTRGGFGAKSSDSCRLGDTVMGQGHISDCPHEQCAKHVVLISCTCPHVAMEGRLGHGGGPNVGLNQDSLPLVFRPHQAIPRAYSWLWTQNHTWWYLGYYMGC